MTPLTESQLHPALCAHGRFDRGDRLVAQRDFQAALRTGKRMRGDHLQVIAVAQWPVSPPAPGQAPLHAPAQTQQLAPGQTQQLALGQPQPQGSRPGRLGLSVSRAVGNSPQRARMRRLLREAFRAVRWHLKSPCDVVIIAKTPWPQAGMTVVTGELLGLLTRMRLATAGVVQ